jgi:hypothetical protein
MSNNVITEKQIALMAYEAHWFGSILRMADARAQSGLDKAEVLDQVLLEYHIVLTNRDRISDDWRYVATLVQQNRETDYLVWVKMRHIGKWDFAAEADAREQFKRFRLAGSYGDSQ